jgi:ABC-type transport system substrate-binding protein
MAWFGGGKKKEGEKKVLRVGTLSAVQDLDPRKTQELGTVMVLTQVFEPPYELPAEDKPPRPLVFAEALRAEDGGASLSGAPRAGVKFSDGTPLTAALAAESLGSTEVVARAATVEARGDRVWFRLRRPNPRFELVLAQSYSSLVLARGGRVLGTGPFVVVEEAREPNVHRLARNPHFRDPVPLDEVVFRTYPDAEALAAAVEAGEVDFTSALSRDDVARVREARKQFLPGASTAILYFNTERPGLTDPRLRRALAHAIDRTDVTRTSYSNALAFAASSLLPPMMGSYRDGITYAPDRSRELIKELGSHMPDRLRMLLVWAPRPYLPQPKTAANVIARQLADVGVRVEVVPTATNEEYNRRIRAGDYDMLLSGWIADSLDPADYLDANLSSELIPNPEAPPVNRANRSRWKDRAMDEALARFREQRSEEARAAVIERMREEVPLLPLMYGPTVVVCGWRVKNFEPSPLGLPSLAAVDVETTPGR